MKEPLRILLTSFFLNMTAVILIAYLPLHKLILFFAPILAHVGTAAMFRLPNESPVTVKFLRSVAILLGHLSFLVFVVLLTFLVSLIFGATEEWKLERDIAGSLLTYSTISVVTGIVPAFSASLLFLIVGPKVTDALARRKTAAENGSISQSAS